MYKKYNYKNITNIFLSLINDIRKKYNEIIYFFIYSFIYFCIFTIHTKIDQKLLTKNIFLIHILHIFIYFFIGDENAEKKLIKI